jgi:hypothetical protein
MTSAEKRIVLEQGSDYRLQLYVKSDDGIGNRDLTGWSWTMRLYRAADGEDVTPIGLVNVPFSGTFVGDDLANGKCTVHIDSTVTTMPDGLSTLIPSGEDMFDTQFNYYYTLTLKGTEGSGTLDDTREMRVMRGKLAVRI